MDPTVARRLREGPDAEIVEQPLDLERRLPDHLEVHARGGVEVDPQLVGEWSPLLLRQPVADRGGTGIGRLLAVGRARVGQTWKPRQPMFTAQSTWATSTATRALDSVPLGVLTVAVVTHGARFVGRDPLLEERVAGGAVGEPLQQHRPPAHGRQQRLGDGEVVAGQVELGLPVLGEEDLVGVGDRHLPSGRLEEHLVVAGIEADRSGRPGLACGGDRPVRAGRRSRCRHRRAHRRRAARPRRRAGLGLAAGGRPPRHRDRRDTPGGAARLPERWLDGGRTRRCGALDRGRRPATARLPRAHPRLRGPRPGRGRPPGPRRGPRRVPRRRADQRRRRAPRGHAGRRCRCCSATT